MDDQELRQRLETMEKQMAEVYAMAKRLYRIIFWTVVVSIAVFVLPLIGLMFEIPSLINTYAQIGNIQ
ncbi:MAG TPA: hypothetical protein VMU25_02760 [Candidatus Paceibacterota bacterium]|nr:hypothetical protein [Candidatus Paceibacterota bacterium]